jgi:hypothetical protein
MDFRSLFKNKYVLSLIVLIVVAVTFAALSQLSNVFYILACLTTSGMCVLVGVKAILDYRQTKGDNKADLLPLTPEQKEMIRRSKRGINANFIIKAIMFFAFALIFIALIFN